MAIKRKQAEALTEFVAEVISVVKEQSKLEEAGDQFHIQMKPEDVEIKGETGFIHDWIRLPETATEDSVPEGSVVDRYLQQMEIVEDSVANASTLTEAFECLVGKTYKFKKMKLGKSFTDSEGKTHPAREFWTPIAKK